MLRGPPFISKCVLRAFSFACCVGLAAAAEANSSYEVQIDSSMKVAHVRALLHTRNGVLSISPIGADQLGRGWATYVQKLAVKDAGGTPLNFEDAKQGWVVRGGFSGAVRLEYDVDLRFAHESWPSGNEQAGWATEGSLFLVNRPLFVFGEDEPASIQFDLPAKWIAVTPWPRSDVRRFEYSAPDQQHLTENTVVVGRPAVIRVAQGPFVLRLALLGRAGAAANLLAPVLAGAVTDYLRMFRGSSARNFLMTFFYADADDGEAYRNSAALTGSDVLNASGKLIWANFIAHEAFHHWNGQMIRSADKPHSRWFSEGLTEYFANAALVRAKVVSPDDWLRKAERHLGLYLLFRSSPVWEGVSLRSAGEKNSSNRPGVYDGGWTAALCLDSEIRKRSMGKRSLRDFMTAMYERYGRSAISYTERDLVRTASDTAGSELTPFFTKYVDGTDQLPVRDCLATFGIKASLKPYAGEAYLHFDRNAGADAVHRRNSLFSAKRIGRS